jgi:hypothetical protein
VGHITGNSVILSSTAGDVIVGAISAGSGGIDITAAGLFQARSSFQLGALIGYIKPRTNVELRSFLEAKGIVFDPDESVSILPNTGNTMLPISILAKPSSLLAAYLLVTLMRLLLFGMEVHLEHS